MTKFYAVAMSAIMAITLVVQAPGQAHAGSKEKALVAGLVVGAAAAALVYAKSKKSGVSWKNRLHANDDCGPGYFMERGKCQVRGGGFKISKFRGGNSKKFRGGNFKVGKKSKFNNWQLAAIRKGCKPGLAWSKFEGCHEND